MGGAWALLGAPGSRGWGSEESEVGAFSVDLYHVPSSIGTSNNKRVFSPTVSVRKKPIDLITGGSWRCRAR